jgi:hypothetical protein
VSWLLSVRRFHGVIAGMARSYRGFAEHNKEQLIRGVPQSLTSGLKMGRGQAIVSGRAWVKKRPKTATAGPIKTTLGRFAKFIAKPR